MGSRRNAWLGVSFAVVTALFVGGSSGCGTDQAGIPVDPGADGGGNADGGSTRDGAASSCAKDSDCAFGTICSQSACVLGCRSGRDCPSIKKICDPTAGPNGACVACAQKSDCPAGNACVQGACIKTCSTEAECPGQHCNVSTKLCVECVQKDQCPIGDVCDTSGKCIVGCDGERDCPATLPHCLTSAPPHGACVQCLGPADCGSGFKCTQNKCMKACGSDGDCPGQHCDPASQLCVQCLDKSQCSLGNVCVLHACTPGCGGDRDCPAGTPRCDANGAPNGKCVQCVGPQDCSGGTCQSGTCVGSTGAPLVAIAGGDFVMGNNGGTATDTAEHTVTLSAFSIDKYEVTNERYGACVTAGACATPAGSTEFTDPTKKNHPVTFVNWDMANGYCQWVGRRLPTEAEWEMAARGSDKRTYPWGGATPTCTLTNGGLGTNGAACVNAVVDFGLYPGGASAFGVHDMAGNAREWVEDWYLAYGTAAVVNPRGPASGTVKLARGGSWASAAVDLTVYTRPQRSWDSADGYIGFRCAKSPGGVAATFRATPATAPLNATFTVDASASSDTVDPSSALTVRWDWENDGIWDTSSTTIKSAQHAYATSGTFTIALEVRNSQGMTERALRFVQVDPATGGDGAACSTTVPCATNYSCYASVCRALCSGPGATCAKPGYTCQLDPANPLSLTYVCRP